MARRGERGHLMAGLMAGIAIMMILSLICFQAWEDVLRRDNEAEMMFRAQDISRAIQKYRLDHGGMAPMKLEDLMEPGPKGQYYLRKLYKDPLMRDGKWGLLYIGPAGEIVDPSAEVPSDLGAGLLFGAKSLQEQKEEKQKQQQQGFGSGDQPSLLGTPQSGEVAGLPIAGVKSLSTETPFRVYKGLTEYSQWLFTYLDLEPALAGAQPGQAPGQLPGGLPGQGTNQGGVNQGGFNQGGFNQGGMKSKGFGKKSAAKQGGAKKKSSFD